MLTESGTSKFSQKHNAVITRLITCRLVGRIWKNINTGITSTDRWCLDWVFEESAVLIERKVAGVI